jgi:hypothetical protein
MLRINGGDPKGRILDGNILDVGRHSEVIRTQMLRINGGDPKGVFSRCGLDLKKWEKRIAPP